MARNVVLLTIDSLRADHATPDADLMPNLNEYADGGVRFSEAYANGYSTPVSFPTILTSTYASHYGGQGYMRDDRPFLARTLREAGYDTAGFHTNPHLRTEKNYDVGFDTYNDFDDETDELSRLRYLVTQNLDSDSRLYGLLKRLYHLFRTTSGSRDYAPAPTLNDRALSWLDAREDDRPFFLWTHYMDVHYPFYPPDEFLKEDVSRNRAVSVNGRMHEDDADLTEEDAADLRALYRGEVRYMDHHLGELVEAFRERDLLDETVFVVTSDHGELFGEGGLYGHPPSARTESYHVPLVLFGGGVEDGRTVDRLSSLLDVPPTVADLVGVEGASAWDGESLAPSVRGETQAGEKTVVLGNEDILVCRSPAWKLVWYREDRPPGAPDDEWVLRDAETGRRVSVDDHEDVVAGLREEMEAYLDGVEDSALAEPDVDESTQDRLEALGYK